MHGADGEGRLQFALARLFGDEEVAASSWESGAIHEYQTSVLGHEIFLGN